MFVCKCYFSLVCAGADVDVMFGVGDKCCAIRIFTQWENAFACGPQAVFCSDYFFEQGCIFGTEDFQHASRLAFLSNHFFGCLGTEEFPRTCPFFSHLSPYLILLLRYILTYWLTYISVYIYNMYTHLYVICKKYWHLLTRVVTDILTNLLQFESQCCCPKPTFRPFKTRIWSIATKTDPNPKWSTSHLWCWSLPHTPLQKGGTPCEWNRCALRSGTCGH